MNKKNKTLRTSANSNNGPTNNFLDERGEAMLSSSTVASSSAECSPIFRHTGSIYQIGNKSEFEDTRGTDMVRSSNFSSPMAETSRDLVRPLMSPRLEVVKDGIYRPSSTERPSFSNDVSSLRHSASDRRLKHFAPTASPTLPPSHLLTASMSLPLAMTSHSQNIELNLPKRSKLLHNYMERSGTDGFNNNIVDLSNVPNLVVVSSQSGPLDDVEQLATQASTSEMKKEPSYRPQVEAISPTGSGDEMSPDDLIRHSKDEILQKINRLDRLISNVDQKVNKLRRLKEPLEEKSIHQPEEEMERPVPTIDLSKLGVAHSIYSENRAKALESHQFMRASGFEFSLPLYQKPSDAHVYHDNIKKFAFFKPNLIAYIKKRKLFETKRDLYLCKKYDRLSEAWVQRMDRIENNPKKRAKDAKTREIFEKVFPELRRKREEKERLAKMVKKSEADSAVDQEEADVRARMGMAAEPPIMLNALARKKRFLSENGRIHDNFELGRMLPGIKKFYWTKSECDIFRETYVAHPKNFARIASQLQNKSIQDCVYFYYVMKKEEGYKQLVRRHNMSRRKHDKAKKAHKEVKEEKVEENEEIKDLKFLPSSPVVSVSSIFNSYQFKLPQYLLLPSSSQSTTPVISSSPSASPVAAMFPVKCSPPPSPLQNLAANSTTYYLGMVKQEPDVKFSPSPSSQPPLTTTLSSFSTSPIVLTASTTSTLSSVLPISQLPSSEAFHSVVQNILPVSSFSSSTSLLSSTPTSTPTNQILTSTTTSSSNIVAVTTVSGHQQPTHPGVLPPPLHVGGSIVQGTPVVVSHSNELTTWQQLQLHLFLQQQFHQQQQRLDQTPPPPSQFNPLSLGGQDLKVLVNQLTANQQMQETRGSIIKGTPNHVLREPPVSRVSPAINRSSPKRPPSGRSKAPSRNENNPLRPEGGLTPGEDGSRLFEHSRDILIDDYMTAQKMNCQQKTFSSYSEQLPLKKHGSLKRKFGPLPLSEGLAYFSGMEVPKGNVPHPSNETARSLIDSIISQNIVKSSEEERILLKSSEAARPVTPSRIGTNFQPPGSHYFSTSCGPVSALQSSMIPLIPPPPFFTSGLPLLQGPFLYPPATPLGTSEKGKMERPNFSSPPPTQRSPLPQGVLRSTVPSNSHNPRNSSEGGKMTPRHSMGTLACTNNIYNFISSTHSMHVQSSSSSLNAAFAQLPPAMISQPSSSSQMLPVPSSTSPGFHSPASFLQMFPLGQFMSNFPIQMPQRGVIPPSTITSRHPMPPSSLFMSQLIQNFHQQFSGGGGAGMLTAVAAAAPKSTSATSGHM